MSFTLLDGGSLLLLWPELINICCDDHRTALYSRCSVEPRNMLSCTCLLMHLLVTKFRPQPLGTYLLDVFNVFNFLSTTGTTNSIQRLSSGNAGSCKCFLFLCSPCTYAGKSSYPCSLNILLLNYTIHFLLLESNVKFDVSFCIERIYCLRISPFDIQL